MNINYLKGDVYCYYMEDSKYFPTKIYLEQLTDEPISFCIIKYTEMAAAECLRYSKNEPIMWGHIVVESINLAVKSNKLAYTLPIKQVIVKDYIYDGTGDIIVKSNNFVMKPDILNKVSEYNQYLEKCKELNKVESNKIRFGF